MVQRAEANRLRSINSRHILAEFITLVIINNRHSIESREGGKEEGQKTSRDKSPTAHSLSTLITNPAEVNFTFHFSQELN
jgi:hypothetical protein